LIRTNLLSGAPYEKEMRDDIITAIDDVSVSSNPFRYERNKENTIEDEELLELWKKIK
jgi:hypothetical protein